MLKTILPIILALVLLLTGCQSTSTRTSPTPPVGSPTSPPVTTQATSEGIQIGNLAPDFQLQNLDGQAVSLSDLRGKPVLINFWATWCPPCRGEMPYIQQIYDEWSDKGLMLLAIDIGENSALVKDFLETNKFSMPVLLDTNSMIASKYSITAIPTTFFIDKNGIIQEKRIGAFSNQKEIEDILARLFQ